MLKKKLDYGGNVTYEPTYGGNIILTVVNIPGHKYSTEVLNFLHRQRKKTRAF
jgi:ABC-type transport system involved in cytochrome c biogenesis permease subunit